jgi:hypothetical protein
VIDFLPCRSKSISDRVNRSETNKVSGFVGSKGVGVDPENFCEFIIKPLLD